MLTNVVDVTDPIYGAVGDGVTDDSIAIRAAAAAASGKILFFPPGLTFLCVDGFDLLGDRSQVFGYASKIIYPASSEARLHCIRIKGNGVAVRGIEIVSPQGLNRDDTGFAISVGDTSYTTYDATIQDVICDGIGSAGIWLSRCVRPKVTGSTIKNCLADGIHLADGCFDAVITGNILSNNADDNIAAVNDLPGTPYVGRILIADNVIEGGRVINGKSGHGIALIGVAVATISGNLIANTAGPGIGTYYWNDPQKTDHIAISGGIISNCGARVDLFGGVGINLQLTGKCSISGVEISNIQNVPGRPSGAIRATDCQELYVNACTLANLNGDGVVIPVGANVGTVAICSSLFGSVAGTPVNINAPLANRVRVNYNTFCATMSADDIYVRAPSAVRSIKNNDCLKNVNVA